MNEVAMPVPRTLGLVAYLIVYPLIHVPHLLLCIWPLIVGLRYHWGPMTFGLCARRRRKHMFWVMRCL